MEAGTVSVWRSVRAHGDTKTQRSRRTLKLPEIAVEALHQQMRRQADERSNAGELWQEHGLVFTTTVGTPYESHNLRRDFSRVTKAAGIGAQWVPKELRTSFVGMVSYQGVPVEEIARLTGPKRYVVLDTDVASRAIKGKLGEPPQVSALIVAQIEWQRTSVQATAPR
jgi:integrase